MMYRLDTMDIKDNWLTNLWLIAGGGTGIGILLVAAVLTSLDETKQEISEANPIAQPSTRPLPTIEVKRDATGQIDTLDWLTFRHAEYSYELKYPRGARVKSREWRGSDRLAEDGINVVLGGVGGGVTIDSGLERKGVSDAEQHAEDIRRSFAGSITGPAVIELTEVVLVNGNDWQGYRFTFAQDMKGVDGEARTQLFIEHNGVVYRVMYKESHPIEASIVSTLRFLE